jgi:NitT/TauT family transport system substrate-binding protein
MTMTGQIDIGRGAAPFGLELVDEGKIRVIARGSEIKVRADQTVRICMANAQVLGKRGDAVARFMQGYRDTLDWMYADPAALAMYETFAGVRHELMAKARDLYFPKYVLWPDEIRGLDLVLSDALKNKFITRPLTAAEAKEMIQIPAPVK